MTNDPNYIRIPTRPDGELPALITQEIDSAWRLHWESYPTQPDEQGRWRFDAPGGEYDVTYVNQDELAVFAEVFGDARQIAPRNLARRYSTMRASEPLQLVALDRPDVLSRLQLDLNISASVDYQRTRPWSAALYDWYPEAQGLRYVGRKASVELNYCLFLDRCAGVLEFSEIGTLGDDALRQTVLTACDLYGLAPRLFDPDAGSGWP